MNTVCDSLENVAEVLGGFLHKHRVFYLRCDPEINDFRPRYGGTVALLGSGGEGVQFLMPEAHFNTFVGMLQGHVFGKDRLVFTWDVKKLFSYIAHRVPRPQQVACEGKIVDLKYAEAFLGMDHPAPTTFDEAKRRAREITDERCLAMQSKLYVPLATRVLPKIETYGFRDAEERMVFYSTYQIEGSVNGRLSSRALGDTGLRAHALKDFAARLRPLQDNVFVDLDYKSMEVYVLQWLSGDDRLGKIISSGRDIYGTIYSLLYGRKWADEDRQFIKRVFLPIVYGLGAARLSETEKIPLADAETLITKVSGFFQTAMDWVAGHQGRLKSDPVAVDYFGRRRRYEDNYHAVRNQVIQGPASAVCLDKLIVLYDRLYKSCEIVANVHDQYILDVPRRHLYDVVYNAVQILEGPSDIAPGLKLKVAIRVGNTLADMTQFNV